MTGVWVWAPDKVTGSVLGLRLFPRRFVVVEKHVHIKRWVGNSQNLPPIRPFLTSGIVEKNHRSKSWGFGCWWEF